MPLDLKTPTHPGTAVDLRGIRRVFPGGVTAVDGIDLHIEPGAFVALLGPSGSGKSTLLRIIAGLDRPDAGSVRANASGPSHRAIAYVFQDAHLLPWRDALRNAALPLELMGVGRRERLDAAARALERVGLGDAMTRYPAELSG